MSKVAPKAPSGAASNCNQVMSAVPPVPPSALMFDAPAMEGSPCTSKRTISPVARESVTIRFKVTPVVVSRTD